MSKHKDQHFVPSSYLKAWCDPHTPEGWTPYTWVISKDGKNSKKKAPESIFTESEMYTIKMEDGQRDLSLEKGLSQLEGEFVRIRKKRLSRRQKLDVTEHVKLCAFIAAMHSRTQIKRDHFKSQWKEPLEMMESMKDWARTATTKERRRSLSRSSKDSEGLSYEDVKALYDNPIQNMLPSLVSIETPLISKLDMAVFCYEDAIGFITSDNPCIWYDPQSCKRPPFYRGPALCYDTIEITMPISPSQCVFLNRQGFNGYIDANSQLLDALNSRIRYYANESIIVRKDYKKAAWFDVGIEPKGRSCVFGAGLFSF